MLGCVFIVLVFVFCLWKLIDFMDFLHDGGMNRFLDLLVGRVFCVLMRSGNAIAAAFLDAVA